ncbi:hypothetical protein J2T08_001977 [Neorhizobium galegae]|nr:hypothetical protein [Neorhizobium galegae]MDQ0134059.1 hypothetical protein [Neorhizobium galegae]
MRPMFHRHLLQHRHGLRYVHSPTSSILLLHRTVL